jgi:hypothetical protein
MADDTHAGYGRSRQAQNLGEYESPEEYDDQGDERVVKFLQFPYMTLEASPALAGVEVLVEKVAYTGDTVFVDELGPMYLEKGERLGAFYTTAELDAMEEGGDVTTGEVAPADFSEMGAHELAEYIEKNQPNVSDTIALAGNDADAAKRVLEAENIVTDNDPRKGVVDGLQRVISEAQ